MKPFDLQEALNGAPVKLKNGNKAFITFNLSNLKDWSKVTDRPLIGYSLNKSESLEDLHSWTLCGWSMGGSDLFDIIGMWEEPELTSEQVLEKAYSENLIVCWENNDGELFEGVPVAKTKDGRYLFKDCCDFFLIDNEGGVWLKDGAQTTKYNTITVTLPKPFKPKEGEVYYSICGYHNGMIDEMHANCMTHISILSGNCFRTESDAQAWLDAMKNALDD